MTLLRFKITNHPQQVAKRGVSDAVDERITPPHVIDPLQAEFVFTLDAAANERNAKAPNFFDLATDGLAQSWGRHRVWCNPPFSNIRPWVEKAWAEHSAGSPLIAMLLPANRCEQGWWQDPIEPFRDGRGVLETRFYRRRFNFGVPGNEGAKYNSAPPFGCVLVIWHAAPAGTRPQGQDAAGGLVRSTSDAVPEGQAPTLKSTPTRTAK